MESHFFLHLPEDVFYSILGFLECPNRIAPFVCNNLSVLSKNANQFIEKNERLWEIILYGYAVQRSNKSNRIYNPKPSEDRINRKSKRLRKTFKEQVISLHKNISLQTEFALQALSEISMSKRDSLTLSKLRSILSHFGPNLNINQRSAIGGTFLVDCCRARYVHERVILSCVKELILKHYATPNVPAVEGNGIRGYGLTSLVVASARAMPTVVKFLLSHGASANLEGTSRFRLFSNPHKSVSGTYTPLAFANKIKAAEIENNVQNEDLKLLSKCIKILERVMIQEKKKSVTYFRV